MPVKATASRAIRSAFEDAKKAFGADIAQSYVNHLAGDDGGDDDGGAGATGDVGAGGGSGGGGRFRSHRNHPFAYSRALFPQNVPKAAGGGRRRLRGDERCVAEGRARRAEAARAQIERTVNDAKAVFDEVVGKRGDIEWRASSGRRGEDYGAAGSGEGRRAEDPGGGIGENIGQGSESGSSARRA